MKGMTRTPYSVRVATHNLYPIYRTVWYSHGHFYVKYKNEIYNVDADINEHKFIRREEI